MWLWLCLVSSAHAKGEMNNLHYDYKIYLIIFIKVILYMEWPPALESVYMEIVGKIHIWTVYTTNYRSDNTYLQYSTCKIRDHFAMNIISS